MAEQQTKVKSVKRDMAKTPKLLFKDLQQTEFAFPRFSVVLSPSVKLDHLKEPSYWANVAHMFHAQQKREPDRAGTIIEVRTDDHSLYAEFYVRAVQKAGLVVECIREDKIGPKVAIPAEQDTNYMVRYNRGVRMWQVLRKSDDEIVHNAQLKEDAVAWIREQA